jgi:hypothetical protein
MKYSEVRVASKVALSNIGAAHARAGFKLPAFLFSAG